MGEYMVFIWDDESAWAAAEGPTIDAAMRAHEAFMSANAGVLRGGNRLHPSTTATSIRREGEQLIVTDGVFAETKEHIGGYYLFVADDLDAALRIAGQVPCPFGWVELRPVYPGG